MHIVCGRVVCDGLVCGRVVCGRLQQKEHTQHYPAAGRVEHCPEEIWSNTQEVMRAGLAAAGLRGQDLAALGITNQRETTVAWNT